MSRSTHPLIRVLRTLTLVFSVAFFTAASGALIGVSPDYPRIDYNNTGVLSFNAGTGELKVDATPLEIRFTSTSAPAFVVDPRSVKIRITAGGASCDVLGGNSSGGPDLEVIGDVYDENFVLIKSGVLLTGSIVDMGSATPTATTSAFDFRFNNAGGLLVTDGDWPVGADIAVVLTGENSTFGGGCTTSFAAGAKGAIGPVEPPSGNVCDLTLTKQATPDKLGPFYNGSGGGSWGGGDHDNDDDSDSHHDRNKSGDSDDSDEHRGKHDSSANQPLNCGCKDRVTQLTVRYNLPTANQVEVRRNGGGVIYGPTLLQPGQEFTFNVLGRKIDFLINMQSVEVLDTGCDHPIGANQPIGDGKLIVVSGKSKMPGNKPLCPFPGTTCDADHQVTYTYTITNNGTAVDNVVVFDDRLGVIGDPIPLIGVAPNNVVTLQATACIFENTINKATANGNQGEGACVSNQATETVTILKGCSPGHHYDSDSDSHVDWNVNNDSDDSDSDSGTMDCDKDEDRSCHNEGWDSDSDSGKDGNNSRPWWKKKHKKHDEGDTDDSDSDSGPLDCDKDGR